MPRYLVVEVSGIPVPQGSMRLLKDKQGNSYMTHASSKLTAWRNAIRDAVAAKDEDPIDGPVRVHCSFRLPRPATVRRDRPTVAPDVDKLARACLDAIEASGLLRTDAQVVHLNATKFYAWGEPGMTLQIEEVEDE